MAKVKASTSKPTSKSLRPASTPEGRENQLISLAVDLAEQQLLDGSASSQVITHFLKLGTEKARLEREKLTHETELLKAKKVALESNERIEAMYKEAMSAFRSYTPEGGPDVY